MKKRSDMKGDLNIIVYGKNILTDIYQIIYSNPSIEVNSQFKNTYSFVEDKTEWKYFLIPGEYNQKTIETILKKHYSKKFNLTFFNDEKSNMEVEKNILLDVLIICVDQLEDENSKKIFKDIQNYSRCASKSPFVIFLTYKDNNPDCEKLWDLISNKFFDRRNFYSFKFPSTNEEKQVIDKKLHYFCNYYNSIGSTESEKINSLNVMIVGQAGAGKSTLQNLLQREKIAREGEGGAITYKISFYSDTRYNITKIDCPGFENEKTVTYVRDKIRELRNTMISTKEHIDCIIYLIKSAGDRIFYDMEKELIKELIQFEEIDVIFCSNTFGMEEESDEYFKNKEIIEDSLNSLMMEIPQFPDEKKEKIIDSIVYVNLVQKFKNNKEVQVNCYGIDKLLAKMYELLEPKKIDELEIRKAKNVEELINISKRYELLKMFREKGDFRLKNRITLSKYILSCAKDDFWKDFLILGLFTLNSRREDMIKKICGAYGYSAVDIQEINKELEKVKWEDKVEEFFDSMKQYKTIFEASGFDFNAKFYNGYTIALGSYLLSKYENNSFTFDKQSFNCIIELAKGLNNGIEGLNKMAEEWEQILKDIESGKSNIEWVRRFFKLSKKE